MSQTYTSSHRIVGLFAHPDDELSVGGTLARYAAGGAQVTLVCATRGEAATIYSPPEYGATRENLGQIRTGELQCCCAALGITDLRWMDWPDGGVAGIDREEAIAAVVKLLREVRPQVMLTHPANGGYPHPDHIAVHEIALAAWYAAAEPGYRPDLGPAVEVAKLYARVIPQSFFESSPAFAEFRISLNGEQLRFFSTPDDEITAVMDVAAWSEKRVAGWECHKSQHNPEGMFSQVSDEVQRAFVSREYLQLLAHRLAAAPQRETDLFAGLEPDDDKEVALVDSGDLSARLMAALRARRGYLTIYQHYLRHRPKPEFVELLQTLVDDTQDATAQLSSALRRLDRSPLQAGAHEKLLGQGLSRHGMLSKLNFMIVGMEKSLQWYASQLTQGDPPEVNAIWEALSEAEKRHLKLTKTLLAAMERSGGTGRDED